MARPFGPVSRYRSHKYIRTAEDSRLVGGQLDFVILSLRKTTRDGRSAEVPGGGRRGRAREITHGAEGIKLKRYYTA